MSEQARHTTARVGLPSDSAAQRARRQRRPTGAPPPLPHPIAISTTAWLPLAVVTLAGAFCSERTSWLRWGTGPTPDAGLIAGVRTPWHRRRRRDKAASLPRAVTVIGLSVVALTGLPACGTCWSSLFFFLRYADGPQRLMRRGRAGSPSFRLGVPAPSPRSPRDLRPHGAVPPGGAGPPTHLRQDRGCRGHACSRPPACTWVSIILTTCCSASRSAWPSRSRPSAGSPRTRCSLSSTAVARRPLT